MAISSIGSHGHPPSVSPPKPAHPPVKENAHGKEKPSAPPKKQSPHKVDMTV